MPFNFSEFILTKPLMPTEKELKNYFREYVTFGGYPEVVLQKDPEIKKTLLQNILGQNKRIGKTTIDFVPYWQPNVLLTP